MTLAERALAKAGSVIERVASADPDKAERLGEKIKGIVGEKLFDKIEGFAEVADDARVNREKDSIRREMMLRAMVGGSERDFTRGDRSSGRGL
ncbi:MULTISPECIES: hypothetical protein [Agrobacterium]|uniref:Uncharacterized protein n=1 Tax=Agrobacterium tumefaciens TaxID=358 RepID=A0AAW8M1H6_AGRTU|nr:MULTISPECIES: hypothetical protein [Agrobacterium]MBP2568734.1 hypothetical protein [Agrobacterium tumefaciens]MDR6705283.1 hypothetical protein [Agrobacterium tumefaciens]